MYFNLVCNSRSAFFGNLMLHTRQVNVCYPSICLFRSSWVDFFSLHTSHSNTCILLLWIFSRDFVFSFRLQWSQSWVCSESMCSFNSVLPLKLVCNWHIPVHHPHHLELQSHTSLTLHIAYSLLNISTISLASYSDLVLLTLKVIFKYPLLILKFLARCFWSMLFFEIPTE